MRSLCMLLLSRVVIDPRFKFMSPAIKINLKYDFYLFKRMHA